MRSLRSRRLGRFVTSVMLRGMRHLDGHGPRRAHIMENNHRSAHAACPVVDRGGGIFNRGFQPVAANEHAIERESHGPILFDGHLHGIERGLARVAVNNSEDLGKGFANGFLAAPTRHGFCNQIKIRDLAGSVGTENGITYRIQRHLSSFFFYVQRIPGGLAIDGVAQRARQRVFEVVRQEIILGPAPYGFFRESFVAVAPQDENRDVRYGEEQSVKGLEAVTIRQR